MFALVKNLFATVSEVGSKIDITNRDPDLHSYFKAEFKNDAVYAYEYFRSTGKLDYGY